MIWFDNVQSDACACAVPRRSTTGRARHCRDFGNSYSPKLRDEASCSYRTLKTRSNWGMEVLKYESYTVILWLYDVILWRYDVILWLYDVIIVINCGFEAEKGYPGKSFSIGTLFSVQFFNTCVQFLCIFRGHLYILIHRCVKLILSS